MKERRNLKNGWLMFHLNTKTKSEKKCINWKPSFLLPPVQLSTDICEKAICLIDVYSSSFSRKLLSFWTKSRLWNTVCLRWFSKALDNMSIKQHIQKSTKIEFDESLLEKIEHNTLGLSKNNWLGQWGNWRVTAAAFGCCYFAIFLTTYRVFWF